MNVRLRLERAPISLFSGNRECRVSNTLMHPPRMGRSLEDGCASRTTARTRRTSSKADRRVVPGRTSASHRRLEKFASWPHVGLAGFAGLMPDWWRVSVGVPVYPDPGQRQINLPKGRRFRRSTGLTYRLQARSVVRRVMDYPVLSLPAVRAHPFHVRSADHRRR